MEEKGEISPCVCFVTDPMNYRRSIAYLFGLQKFGIKLGLSNIKTLLRHLGNPHKKLRCVHIGGSNGKGSTAVFLVSMLVQHGYKVGLFTSPHLIDFTERIRINHTEISKARVALLVKEIRDLCDRIAVKNITFFEFVTAMAFKYFAEEKTDLVVLEVGMGGRLDATNVINPLVSIITSISLEHQLYLGDTITKIAFEKAGIIKKKIPLITGATQSAVKELFARQCQALEAPMFQLGKEIGYRQRGLRLFDYKGLKLELKGLELGLSGDHQIRNAAMAIAAAEILCCKGFFLTPFEIKKGLQETVWPGRLEVIRQRPAVLLDGAHNPDAWKVLKKSLVKYFHFQNLFLVMGVMEDKNIPEMLKILTPQAYKIIFCRPRMERSATQEILQKYCTIASTKKVSWVADTGLAVQTAINEAKPDDLICVTGSLFSVGEAREYLQPPRAGSSGRIPM